MFFWSVIGNFNIFFDKMRKYIAYYVVFFSRILYNDGKEAGLCVFLLC